MQTRVFWIRKSQAKKKEDSPDKLSRVKSHLGSLPQVKRAEVLENFLAAFLSARSTIYVGFLKLEGSIWPRVQACLNFFPPSMPWQRRTSLILRLAQPGAPGVSTCMYHARHYYPDIFDGSTRQGEAITIIVRFVNKQWEIIQRLVRIDIVAKSVAGTQLSQVL